MPKKPMKPCSYAGCPNLTYGTYCREHELQRQKEYTKFKRDPDNARKYGNNWKRIRAAYVRGHPLCEECLKQGIVKPVEEVHHIIPLKAGGGNTFDNLVSLCKSCHMKAHLKLGDRK